MVYYKLVKNTINATKITKVIINVMIKHHDFLKSIINNKEFLFTLKF